MMDTHAATPLPFSPNLKRLKKQAKACSSSLEQHLNEIGIVKIKSL